MATTLNGIKINGKIESINGVKINGRPVSNWKGVKFYRGSTLIGQYDFLQYLKYTINRGSIALPGTKLLPLVYAADASQDWVKLPKDRSDSSTTYGQNIWRGTSGLFRALIAQNTNQNTSYSLNAPSDLQVFPSGSSPAYDIAINESKTDYPEGNLFRWKRWGSLFEAQPTPLEGPSSKYMENEGLDHFLTDAFQGFDGVYPNLDQPRFVLIPSWVNCNWSLTSDTSKIDLSSISYITNHTPSSTCPLILFDESGRASGTTNVDNVAVISYSRYNLAYAAGVAAAEAAARLRSGGFTDQAPIIDIVIGNNRLEDRIDLVNAVVQGITAQAVGDAPIVNVIDLVKYDATTNGTLLEFWQNSQQEAIDAGFVNTDKTDKIIVTDWPEFFEYWNGGDWEENTNVYGIYFGNAPIVHRYNYWKNPSIDESGNVSISSTIQGPVSRLGSYTGRTSESTISSLIYEVYPNYNFNLAADPNSLGSRAGEAILGTPLRPNGEDFVSAHLLMGFDLTANPNEGYEDLILTGGDGAYTEGINVIECDANGQYDGNNIFTYLSYRPQQ